MNKEKLINQLRHALQERDKLEAVYCLEPFMDDPMVLESLCATAIENIDHRLREALIGKLKKVSEMANQYFMKCAVDSPNTVQRCWSLVNLSLLGCRSAKEAVLTGLKDSAKSVRIAAAFNVGLYDDEELQEMLDKFFAELEAASFAEQTCADINQSLILF